MKFMIQSYATQQEYDGMAGKNADTPAWSQGDFAAMVEFMTKFNAELEETGELVETRGLAAPVHTRRIGPGALVTDGPYAETEEVLAGYWIVDCDSFDRATEIAIRLGECPGPAHVLETAYADVRPIDEGPPPGPEL